MIFWKYILFILPSLLRKGFVLLVLMLENGYLLNKWCMILHCQFKTLTSVVGTFNVLDNDF